MELAVLAGAIVLGAVVTLFYLKRAMNAAIEVEPAHPELGPVKSPVELAWYYRPAEVFLRQVINARSRNGVWRS